MAYARRPLAHLGNLGTSADDDRAIVLQWVNAAYEEDAIPLVNALGLLVAQVSGPGTPYPNVRTGYVAAPQNVQDAYARIRASHVITVTGTSDPAANGVTHSWWDWLMSKAGDVFGAEVGRYVVWAALGVAAVVIVPPVLELVGVKKTVGR